MTGNNLETFAYKETWIDDVYPVDMIQDAKNDFPLSSPIQRMWELNWGRRLEKDIQEMQNEKTLFLWLKNMEQKWKVPNSIVRNVLALYAEEWNFSHEDDTYKNTIFLDKISNIAPWEYRSLEDLMLSNSSTTIDANLSWIPIGKNISFEVFQKSIDSYNESDNTLIAQKVNYTNMVDREMNQDLSAYCQSDDWEYTQRTREKTKWYESMKAWDKQYLKYPKVMKEKSSWKNENAQKNYTKPVSRVKKINRLIAEL